jgi:hypothetical protein
MPPAQPDRSFDDKLSRFLFPLALCFGGYFAQASYSQIKSQLDRIEARQQADNITLAELNLRVLQLERLTGDNRSATHQPASRTQPEK